MAAIPRLADPDLMDETLAVVRDARARAPRDFLVALAVGLGAGAVVLLVAAAITEGLLHDLLLNLGAGVISTLLTVVLIDGLWKRQQAGASATLEAMSTDLEQRKTRPMDEDERRAWRDFVDDYRELVRAESPLQRLRNLPAYRRRLRALEERAKQTLEDFPAADGQQPLGKASPQQSDRGRSR